MNDLAWWTLFAVLSICLLVFSLQLIYRVISDVCCEKKPKNLTTEIENDNLRKFQIDSRTIYKELELGNAPKVPEPLQHNAIIEEINKETDGSDKIMEEIDEETDESNVLLDEDVTDEDTFEKKAKEEIPDLSEDEMKILEKIHGIQDEARITAQRIPYCLGGKQHLQYFEINQNLILNLIGLGSLDCNSNPELKKRKQLVSMYIQDCQNELKKKAGEYL